MSETLKIWLERPLWPWPIAVAYTLGLDVKAAALERTAEILERYPAMGSMSDHVGVAAMDVIAQELGAHDGPRQIRLLNEAEQPLMRQLRAGSLEALGRPTPDADLEVIKSTSWEGGEVIYGKFCCLAREGWRDKRENFLHVVLSGERPTIWFHDIRLARAPMLELYGQSNEIDFAPAKEADWSGTMPASAKPNDRKHESFAHAAAAIVREQKVKPSVAFDRVAPSDPMRQSDSVTRAVRRAFDLMYHLDGTPIKN